MASSLGQLARLKAAQSKKGLDPPKKTSPALTKDPGNCKYGGDQGGGGWERRGA